LLKNYPRTHAFETQTEVLTKPQKTSTEKKVAAAEPETKEVPFLAAATESTKRIWKKLEDLFI
jgi:formate C-acetyltransferase